MDDAQPLTLRVADRHRSAGRVIGLGGRVFFLALQTTVIGKRDDELAAVPIGDDDPTPGLGA